MLHSEWKSAHFCSEWSIVGYGTVAIGDLYIINAACIHTPGKCWKSRNRGNVSLLINTPSSHLTHWGRVTHICVGKQTIIGSDNGLSPGRRQAIIWTNDGLLLWIIVNWTPRNKLQWNFNKNSNIFIHKNTYESVVCEMASILSRPQCVNTHTPRFFYMVIS